MYSSESSLMDMVKRSRWMCWRTQSFLILVRRSPGSVSLPANQPFITETGFGGKISQTEDPLGGLGLSRDDRSQHPLNCDPTGSPLAQLSWTPKGFLLKKSTIFSHGLWSFHGPLFWACLWKVQTGCWGRKIFFWGCKGSCFGRGKLLPTTGVPWNDNLKLQVGEESLEVNPSHFQ